MLDGDKAASANRTTSNTDDKYVFEMSRLLKTASSKTDAQLEAGQKIGFGVAYWDPNFSEDAGWNAPSHYVTGCSQNWIDLVLATPDMDLDSTDEGETGASTNPASSVSPKAGLTAAAATIYALGLF